MGNFIEFGIKAWSMPSKIGFSSRGVQFVDDCLGALEVRGSSGV